MDEKILKLRDQVEHILMLYPISRNCDIDLTVILWKEFYPDYLSVDKLSVPLCNLKDVPTQDAIKRFRAQIQNDEQRYLPTDWEIAKRRGWAENDWKQLLGYKTSDGDQMEMDLGGH